MKTMLRNAKYNTIAPAYARAVMLLALIICGGTQVLRAQGYFTLTNGHYYWFDGTENDPDDTKYLTAFDKANSWNEIYKLGTHYGRSVTEIVEQGDTYLALDISDPANPRITSVPTEDGFSPYCVWYRTGNTGNYYQEWDGYRYYLVASHNEGLRIYKVAAGAPLAINTTWYNWDHGAAIIEVTKVAGGEKESYFWMMYDTLDDATGEHGGNPEWRLNSVSSYQRPEEMQLSHYRADGAGGNTWDGKGSASDDGITYYDNVRVNGLVNYPAGVAATFMEVSKTEHEMTISDIMTGQGLVSLTKDGDEISFGGSVSAFANIVTNGSGEIDAMVTEAYTEYNEDIYRRGINLEGGQRTTPGFGYGGVPTVRNWYYYGGSRHTVPPTEVQDNMGIDSVLFSLDNRAMRYLRITRKGTEVTPDGNTHPYSTLITCYDLPLNNTEATITAVVYYDNGTTQTLTTTITISSANLDVDIKSTKAPVIKGYVVGGGKMANVGGNTSVVVHNTDSIYAIYGGNDIAGWVQGEEGAYIQVGTRYTNEEHPIHINYIYGGGCGFYRYSGVYDASTGSWGSDDTKTTTIDYGQYAFRGGVYDWNDNSKVVVEPGTFDYNPYTGADFATAEDGNRFVGTKLGGTIPYVKTAHVSIGVAEVTGHTDALGHPAHEHNDHIYIDSLFGGAENAFIGISSAIDDYSTAVTLDINGGTILAAFGGNNYGGAVAAASSTLVNMRCSKLVDDRALTSNTYANGFGRKFGIRHLFGGGNKVDCEHVELRFFGGMVDTAFVGGNNATVTNPLCTVECRRDGTVYDVNGIAQGEPNFTEPFMNGHFIYTNNTIDSESDTANNGRLWDGYDADNGVFNVHYLYGGNNLAPMDNVSFVQLHSGGIGSVYGGGNQGDMTNNKTLLVAAGDHDKYFNIRPLLKTMRDILARSNRITVPNKVSSVIAASEESKIIVDYVYGGCRNANIKNSCGVYVAGGNYGDIVAGNDVSGDVGSENNGSTYLVVTGDAVVQGNIYGGCDGYYHCDDGTGRYSDSQIPNPFSETATNDPYNDFAGLLMPTQQHANIFVNGGLIKGDVVAGGLLANIGFSNNGSAPRIKRTGEAETNLTAERNSGTVQLVIGDTAEIHGNVFGGGANASIYGLSQVYVKDTPVILGKLFAGNDCVGKVESFLPYQTIVDYSGCTNHADSLQRELNNQASQLSSNGDSLNFRENIPGGYKYSPRYASYVLIEGSPIINSVYGSGNGAWDYDGTHPEYPWTYVCPAQEGSRPDQMSTYIDIHTAGGFIDTVFGGGAGCSVERSVTVLLNNQSIDNPDYPDLSDPKFAHFSGGTKRAGETGKNFVGTIFGGNNFSDMNVVPTIQLVRGNVKNIYGGGNAGDMTKKETVYDICGKEVKDVSTHILSESEYVSVTDSVFGGCRMSDLEGMAYVEVRKTSADGIQYLYGGNDISGEIKGNTRVDMAGGTVNRIWGGSNGRYDFVPIDHEMYNVYPFGTYDEDHPERGLIATAARPNVDSSNVNIWGGTINASVYTGGSMADSRATCLVVNDLIGCSANGISTGDVIINGAVYGGGEGRWDDLNARDLDGKRWGNVTEQTNVHLMHAKRVASATAYGGGGGGDVHNTFIKTYETWNKPFLAIYGGCWGSDVTGTAYLEFDGDTLVNNLFGGNDFTGNVYRTEMVVNSGQFYNVFGGGNGDYPDSYYQSQHPMALAQGGADDVYAGGDSVPRPNTEYIHITFNNGEVDSCLYGGGKLGTVFPYQKNSSGEYLFDQTRLTNDNVYRYIPDTSRTKAETVSNPEDFSYVVLNIHDGKFHRNVFGGGRGQKKNKTPIVYGLKVVNMDGGEIYESLYGGSEFVNDGYRAECKVPSALNPTLQQQKAATTMRPSSIVNLTGGIIGSNFYGAGYQGIVYGSTYVNIGIDAIDSSLVWRNRYGNDTYDSTYIMFKPGYNGNVLRDQLVEINSHSDILQNRSLALNNSVYSGANWGNASGEVTFDNPGFMGGESRIYIDGKGYNTTNDRLTSDPEMIIVRSIFGSGTSVLGGDIHSHVEVRNYGGMEECHPTKTIETIQRTDSLWLHNTAIVFTGTTDASQQYMSNRYSFRNIKQMNYRGYNVSELQATADNVENLGFYEQGTTASIHSGELFDTVEVPLSDLNTKVNNSACGDNVDLCDKEYMVSPTDEVKRHTLIILDNGVNLNISKTENGNTTYGAVTGFGYVTTPGGYQSSINARPKMRLSGGNDLAFNSADGGFVASCQDSNKTRTLSSTYEDINPQWNSSGSILATDELPYTNHAHTNGSGYQSGYATYREWKVGDKMGLREVEATLLAHSDPKNLGQDWSLDIASNSGTNRMGVAEAVFEMPATKAGHYYTLIGEGFTMSGSNGEIDLVDSAWHPSLTAALTAGGNLDMSSALSTIKNAYDDDNLPTGSPYGTWIHIPGAAANEMEGTKQILQNPEYTFGLVMMPNANFATSGATTFDMPSSVMVEGDPNPVNPDQSYPYFVINGNARVNSIGHYCSPKVYNNHDPENPELKPSMRLFLTYDTTFTNTFNGSVTFKMMEYDAEGHEVAPILVKIYIQTIIDELKDMEQDVLAMYNGGRTNTFTRKVEFVPCGEERNLYITGIRWLPSTNNGADADASVLSTSFGDSDRFSMLGDSSKVWAVSGDYPHVASVGHPGDNNHNSHNRFAMAIIPSNNVSQEAGMANGWIRGTDVRTNLYKLAYPDLDGTTPKKICKAFDAVGDTVTTFQLKNTNGNDNHGYFLGTLDGRGSAMLDVELTFDGSRVYDAMDGKGYVGKVILTMESFSEEDDISRGTFDVTIYVKTRSHGDTIYIASANSVTRQVAHNKSVTVYPYSDAVHNPGDIQKGDIGKSPGLYVQSFRKALDDGIYQEGDVLCIIDTVKIDELPVHITGPNGPAIEVIRYDGHHPQLPDEQSVYRGPMIVVSEGGSFTAENIAFHGGAGAHINHIKRTGGGGDYDGNHDAVLDGEGNLQFWNYTYGGRTVYMQPDTNRAFAPIIQVIGSGSTVNLREGTIVQHNWNEYNTVDANGMPVDSKNMGAISVTDGATLNLAGNVTVENNFSHPLTGHDDLASDSIAVQKAPGGGAIYVDGGTIVLPESNRNTAITITNNYLMNSLIYTDPSAVTWWNTIQYDGVPERFSINPEDLRTWQAANVLLTREAPATGTYFEKTNTDTQSDIIVISGTLGDATKIGVRKWFPGLHDRDTIRFATIKGGNNTILAVAVNENENFISDEGFNTFYNPAVDLSTAYFFRCASFRHQLASDNYVGPVHNRYNELTLASDDVLHFGTKANLCPTGGDSIIYRVQGGMMPYTYTWSDPVKGTTLSTKTTPYNDAQVQYDLANTNLSGAERTAKYAASMADTLLLPNEPIDPTTDRLWNHLRVTATDATGVCRLYKDIDLRIKMDHNATDATTYWPTASAIADTASHTDNSSPWQVSIANTGWVDTSRTAVAVASRNFTGVQITPMVWVDRSNGTISAAVAGDKNDNVYQWTEDAEGDTIHELTNLFFCPGDLIYLNTQPRSEGHHFVMWDFDPYYRPLAQYLVPSHDASVTAYYGPDEYWIHHITNESLGQVGYDQNYDYTRPIAPSTGNPAGYATTYNGDVHIYNEEGLAWFISVVNGINGTQARQFYFNKVYLHKKDALGTAYDMKDYLWTPVGTHNHPFRGWFIGVSENETTTEPLSGEQVIVKNIILNEPEMAYTGFFGFLDTARVSGIKLQAAMIRGSQYVGALAANTINTKIDNCAVADATEGGAITTILTTHYVSGGMVGNASHSNITNATVAAKYVGDAVYSGGVIGYGDHDTVNNSWSRNDLRMSGLYFGGIAGNMKSSETHVPTGGLFNRLFAGNSNTVSSYIANNYVRIIDDSKTQRVGGIVGLSENTVMENNYMYGDMNGTVINGTVAAVMEDGTAANGNYAEQSAAAAGPGIQNNGSYLGITAAFTGSGNQVSLDQQVAGVDNLTRVLNNWVRYKNNEGGNYRTWRSDLDHENNGYPIFGTPDLIPVRNYAVVNGCDYAEWDGRYYHDGDTLTVHIIDSVQMVDSLTTLRFVVHHSSVTELSDSTVLGEDYDGYGFHVSAIETSLLLRTVQENGSATLTVYDTLTGAYGCDSIISLTLTITGKDNTGIIKVEREEVPAIKVYPNPTTSLVTVETEQMSHVELYDNEGRKLEDYRVYGDGSTITIDLERYSSGIYYLRVYTPNRVNIQKVIKR